MAALHTIISNHDLPPQPPEIMALNHEFIVFHLGFRYVTQRTLEIQVIPFILCYFESVARSMEVMTTCSSFLPFGKFMFCSDDGVIYINEISAIVRKLHSSMKVMWKY